MISPCQYGLHAPDDCSPSIPVLNLILLEVVASSWLLSTLSNFCVRWTRNRRGVVKNKLEHCTVLHMIAEQRSITSRGETQSTSFPHFFSLRKIQSGEWALKNLYCWPLFSSIFDNSSLFMGQLPGQALLGHFLGSTITIITPMRQVNTSGRAWQSGPPCPTPGAKWSKIRGSQMLMLRVKTLSAPLTARDHHWRNPRKKEKSIESAAIQKHLRVWQCTDWLWGTQCHAKWQMGCKEYQDPARIKPKSPNSLLLTLTTEPLVHVN